LTASTALVLIDGDIGKPETAAKVVEAAIKNFGSIDLLVSNAGIFFTKPFTKFSTADFNALVSTIIVIGATFDPIEVTPIQLISGSRSIQGWASGTPADSEDTLRFAELTGVRPMIETYPLEKADEAYARMLSGKAQFRVVLTM
jgi:D-arabinose 1-dehydrogenase-like Zn-dependent alcohol dehydrogenase